MAEEILISTTAMETLVAVVENGVLQDIHIERVGHRIDFVFKTLKEQFGDEQSWVQSNVIVMSV